MQTPTLDHSSTPRKGECVCTPYALCSHCYGRLERYRADQELQRWLETYGVVPKRAERVAPVLRLVR
jgi:hypothetical protein